MEIGMNVRSFETTNDETDSTSRRHDFTCAHLLCHKPSARLLRSTDDRCQHAHDVNIGDAFSTGGRRRRLLLRLKW